MHPGVKYARRKEVADLVSSQVLQKTLDELRNITRIDLCVTNTDGVLLVTTFPETAIDAESIRSFVLSAADSQIVQEYHYFKVYDNQNVEYILISKGSSDDAYMIGKVAVCEIQNLIIAYKERLDKNNFIQNLLLDNLLLVDVYNRAKKLRIDTDVRRVVYMVETKLEKDISAQETVKSLFASRPRDFITAVDEKSIIIVKELKDTDTFEDMNQTARMLVDMLNAEAMSQVRVSYGNPVNECIAFLQRGEDGTRSRKNFLRRQKRGTIQQPRHRPSDLSAPDSAVRNVYDRSLRRKSAGYVR